MWLALSLVVGLAILAGLVAVVATRAGRSKERASTLEIEHDLRTKAADARDSLTPADRKRLREKYGKRE